MSSGCGPSHADHLAGRNLTFKGSAGGGQPGKQGTPVKLPTRISFPVTGGTGGPAHKPRVRRAGSRCQNSQRPLQGSAEPRNRFSGRQALSRLGPAHQQPEPGAAVEATAGAGLECEFCPTAVTPPSQDDPQHRPLRLPLPCRPAPRTPLPPGGSVTDGSSWTRTRRRAGSEARFPPGLS